MFPQNILSWSKKYGIPPEILLDRLASRRWDLFAAFVVPADVNIEHIFIGLNNKSLSLCAVERQASNYASACSALSP